MLAPFECLCGNFILPEPASYVFFYAVFNLRNLLYLIPVSFNEANEMIDRYIHFYNHERIQTKTGVAPLTLRHSA